jgi:hypothetical protein
MTPEKLETAKLLMYKIDQLKKTLDTFKTHNYRDVKFGVCGMRTENGNAGPDTICEIYDDELTDKFKEAIEERIAELSIEFRAL